MAKEKIKIVEVGARDGLQNESATWSVENRVQMLRHLLKAGLRHLEGGSFVSPKAIPQMADSDQVWRALEGELPAKAELSFLVPNEKGLERAQAAGVKSIAIFSATSDSFTQKNIGKSVDDSLREFSSVAKAAKKSGMTLRGYVSTVFGCPYEGEQNPKRALQVIESLFKMGCREVSVGDTIGVAHPLQVRAFFKQAVRKFGAKKLAGHFHDTRGMAIVNIREALDAGIRTFDSSIGGLGGCPYAPGAAGNVATEEVAWMLEGFGFETGLSIPRLLEAAAFVEGHLGRPLKAKLYLSRPRQIFYFSKS